MAVGAIFDPRQAQDVLPGGCADLVVLELAMTDKPCWPLRAAQALRADPDSQIWRQLYARTEQRRGEVGTDKARNKA